MASRVLRALHWMDSSPGPAWLSAFVACVAPALQSLPPDQLSSAYAAAVDLEPHLGDGWGTDFRLLLQPRTYALTPQTRGDCGSDCGDGDETAAMGDPSDSSYDDGDGCIQGDGLSASGEDCGGDPDQGLRGPLHSYPGLTHALQRPSFRRL
jgi:hypothetical protein